VCSRAPQCAPCGRVPPGARAALACPLVRALRARAPKTPGARGVAWRRRGTQAKPAHGRCAQGATWRWRVIQVF
jgi:hypothetical protein